MELSVAVQNASGVACPSATLIRRWVAATLAHPAARARLCDDSAELSVRLVDCDEIEQLNTQYRHQAKPTNVLSFPADLPEGVDLPLLGDIAVCAQVVEREAQEQGKTARAHWAHMLVHGTLHLLGFDHIDDRDADEMEALEVAILDSLKFPNPYNNNPKGQPFR